MKVTNEDDQWSGEFWLTNTSVGFGFDRREIMQKRGHVEFVEPEQGAVRAIDEVVVAYIRSFIFGQIQD